MSSREVAIDSSSSPTSFSLVVEVDDSQPNLMHHFELTQRVDGKANGDPVSVSAEFGMEVQLVYSHASRFFPCTVHVHVNSFKETRQSKQLRTCIHVHVGVGNEGGRGSPIFSTHAH